MDHNANICTITTSGAVYRELFAHGSHWEYVYNYTFWCCMQTAVCYLHRFDFGDRGRRVYSSDAQQRLLFASCTVLIVAVVNSRKSVYSSGVVYRLPFASCTVSTWLWRRMGVYSSGALHRPLFS